MPPYSEMKSSSLGDDDASVGLAAAADPANKLLADADDRTAPTTPGSTSTSSLTTSSSGTPPPPLAPFRDRSVSDATGERRATISAARPPRRARSRIQSMPAGSSGAQDFFGAPPQPQVVKVTSRQQSLLGLGTLKSEDEGDDGEGAKEEAKDETSAVAIKSAASPLPLLEQTKEEDARGGKLEAPPTPAPMQHRNQAPSPSLPAGNVNAAEVDAGCQCVIL